MRAARVSVPRHHGLAESRCSAAVAPISFVAYHLCIEVQRINLLMGLLNFCLRRESLFFGYSGAKNEPLARAFFFVYRGTIPTLQEKQLYRLLYTLLWYFACTSTLIGAILY